MTSSHNKTITTADWLNSRQEFSK